MLLGTAEPVSDVTQSTRRFLVACERASVNTQNPMPSVRKTVFSRKRTELVSSGGWGTWHRRQKS